VADPVDAAGREGGVLAGDAGHSRARRLLGGWSANLLQLTLGITQQLALVPVFLHFGSRDLLAAWLALYAAGNLALVADVGLQARAINRFLAFKSCVDGEGRMAHFFAHMQRLYLGLTGLLIALVIAGCAFRSPAHALGYQEMDDFSIAFVIMTAGMLSVLPSNLVSALYRAHGLYARAVWIQCAAMLASQLAQLVAIVATARLIPIVIAFVAPQVIAATWLVMIDAPRLFPLLSRVRTRARPSWRWIAGQFRRAFPFGVAGGTDVALQNLPVLLVSAIVADRVAVAQWGLTRVVAGLVRALCVQTTLPLAAELGYDRAIGARQALRRLYARGSVLVTLLASVVVSALLAFWKDFFALWTHGTIPYDPPLTLTLLIGAQLAAPSFLALGFTYYSDRGELLARTKGLQFVAFVALAPVLTARLGPLGTALALVATDLLVQFGLLTVIVMWQTLVRPARHLMFLAALMLVVTAFGTWLGEAILSALPGTGFARFVAACTLWAFTIGLLATPLVSRRFRERLADMIPG